MEEERIDLLCCGSKKNDDPCDHVASVYLDFNKIPEEKPDNDHLINGLIGFCKTHQDQHKIFWSKSKTSKLFKEEDEEHECNYVKKDGTFCGKKSKYVFKANIVKQHYCTKHYRTELEKRMADYSLKSIKNISVKKIPTIDLQIRLIGELDKLLEHFTALCIEEVVIENQPSLKNPKMKSIASTILDYFLIRGFIDNKNGLNIKLVRYFCPSNKLLVNKDNTLEVFNKMSNKTNNNSRTKYKMTKELGIKYTRQLLETDKEQTEYLNLFKKKDDLCDSFLQALYYMKHVRKGSNSIIIKKITGSKRSTKKSNNSMIKVIGSQKKESESQKKVIKLF